jgi:hypothetical protein
MRCADDAPMTMAKDDSLIDTIDENAEERTRTIKLID